MEYFHWIKEIGQEGRFGTKMTRKREWEGWKKNFLLLSLVLLAIVSSSESRAVTQNELVIKPVTSTISNWNASSESNYKIHLLLAQEQAKCLRNYGGQGKDDGEQSEDMGPNRQGPFVNFRCIKTLSTFTECDQCSNMVRGIPTVSRCNEICGSNASCQDKCLGLVEKVNKILQEAKTGSTEVNQLELVSSGLILRPPEVFCEDMSLPEATEPFHIVVLKWAVEFGQSGNNSTTNQPIPIVFVLQRMDVKGLIPQWETRGTTLSLIQPVNSPYDSMTYRYRITAVGPDGALGRVESGDIATHDGFTKAEPPKRIYKLKEVVHDESIDILIGWDPPEDKPCDYKVMQSRQDGEGKSKSHRLTATDLENGFQVWFYGLKFKETYEVSITSRRARWDGFQSDLKSESFIMPTCLMAHNHRFDKCVPSPPRNLGSEDVVIIEQKNGEGKGQIKVKWDPPLHTSPQNKLESYSIIVGKPESDTRNASSIAGHSFGMAALTQSQATYLVSGDVTQFVIKDVILNRRYQIFVIATSIKGDSPPAHTRISTYIVKEEDEESLVSTWIYLSIPISLMILGIFGCHFLRVYVQKRQVKQARKQYFQSMDERDAMSPDWSIVPLSEDSPNLKCINDGPKEKWEICYENLILGEVIGQGAFGVVRKAKMIRKKNQISSGGKFSILSENSELDENGMETVAVKMLKVSATRDDRDQLIKEIVTMQHLGAHPQIVSLLGACTKGRSLCLVLEFCPGGDLLSFLRKVRAKYWPTLGLTNKRQSWGGKTVEKQNLLKDTSSLESGCDSDVSFNSTTKSQKSSDSSPMIYADTVPTSPSFLLSPTDTVINHQYGKIPALNPEDDCRPIDEKDILSYARQIAMGMEFLEKNRVVHRDLAGRNVLLLGDFKQVKISDFGLSRDIYTWNVYHQKTNGKLPIKWMAIESIFTHVFTTKSDVWSFGILLWELVTLGGTPYPGLGNTELFHLLKSGYRMERPDNCSEEIYALMKKCWRTSPVSRPNFTELRRFLETMLEAAEPSLYLSLMADIPVDYFHISSRSDLVHLKLEDDSPLRENSGGPYNFGYPGQAIRYPLNSQTSTVSNLYSSTGPKKERPRNPRSPSSTPSVPDLPSASRLLAQGHRQETSASTTAISLRPHTSGANSPLRRQGSTRESPNPIRSHLSFKRTRSRSLRSNDSLSRIPLNESLQEIKRLSIFGGRKESLVSPDSGHPRSDSGGGADLEDDPWSDIDPEIDPFFTRRPTSLRVGQSSPLTRRILPTSIPLKNLNTMTRSENRVFLENQPEQLLN